MEQTIHTKTARQSLLLSILKEKGAQTQEDIRREMRRRGIEVSQVTVSRDLRDLRIPKVAGSSGRSYALGAAAEAEPALDKLRHALKEFARVIAPAGQFVVVKTPASGAQPVGQAFDDAGLKEVAGTIAGDDTVFILLWQARDAAALARRLKELAAS